MSAIEKSNIIPFSKQLAPHEAVAPCILTYEDDHQHFYCTLATQGASYLQYVDQQYQNGSLSSAELITSHNLTVCALVAIAEKLRLEDELEVGDQLFRLVGDMFAGEENSTRHNILVAQICTNAVEFIQSHIAPEPERCFEYPAQLDEIFDFS